MSKQQKVSELEGQVEAEVVKKIQFNVKYHYAHVTEYGEKLSVVELLNVNKGVIRINDTLIDSTSLVARFAPVMIQTLNTRYPLLTIESLDIEKESEEGLEEFNTRKLQEFNELNRGYRDIPTMDIDMYSGLVAVTVKTYPPYYYDHEYTRGYIYSYNPGTGRNCILTKPAEEFGYIMESPPRMVPLLFKGLAVVENLYKGIIKFRTSSFDLNGYVGQLFPQGILEITQLADKAKMQGNSNLREVRDKKGSDHKVRENEEFELVSNSSSIVPIEVGAELLGDNIASLQIADH